MRHLDQPRWKTNNHQCSLDPHFQDGVGSLSLLFLPLKVANTSFIDICNQLPVRLPKMQNHKTVNTPFMLIVRMRQEACPYWFCFKRRPIPSVWMFATNRQLDCWCYKTKSHWRSVDTHCQDWVESQWLLFLHLKTASISFMDVCNQLPLRLPKMESQSLLTHHWHSFLKWGSYSVAFPIAYKGCW